MDEKKNYTVKKVNLDGSKEIVEKKNLPKGHLDIIQKQLKQQAKEMEAKFLEDKKKRKNRKKNKNARKSRKNNRK